MGDNVDLASIKFNRFGVAGVSIGFLVGTAWILIFPLGHVLTSTPPNWWYAGFLLFVGMFIMALPFLLCRSELQLTLTDEGIQEKFTPAVSWSPFANRSSRTISWNQVTGFMHGEMPIPYGGSTPLFKLFLQKKTLLSLTAQEVRDEDKFHAFIETLVKRAKESGAIEIPSSRGFLKSPFGRFL